MWYKGDELKLKYRHLLEYLMHAADKELDMDVMIGTEDGFVSASQINHITDATDPEDLFGNTLAIDTL